MRNNTIRIHSALYVIQSVNTFAAYVTNVQQQDEVINCVGVRVLSVLLLCCDKKESCVQCVRNKHTKSKKYKRYHANYHILL